MSLPSSATRSGEVLEDELNSEAPIRFEPKEEASLLNTSNAQKAEANKLFNSSRFSEAIGTYDKALSSCPNYLHYEIAVLKSNIAACHLKLEEWKEAVECATASLASLDLLQKPATEPGTAASGGEKEQSFVELKGDDDEIEKQMAELELSDQRKEDIQRIRAKALLRRAKGKMEQGGWANLAGAEEDYKELSKLPNLPIGDRETVRKGLANLPPQINAAKDKEMGEMMGKLKELGNGILKPFGLSTDMFKFNKDENTGGYSMAFDQSQKS